MAAKILLDRQALIDAMNAWEGRIRYVARALGVTPDVVKGRIERDPELKALHRALKAQRTKASIREVHMPSTASACYCCGAVAPLQGASYGRFPCACRETLGICWYENTCSAHCACPGGPQTTIERRITA